MQKLYFLISLICCRVYSQNVGNELAIESIRMPNSNNDDCINRSTKYYDIRVYNQLEIVNVLSDFPLKELLTERNIMTENNNIFNNYLYCIWRQRLFISKTNDFNYSIIEQVVGEAVGKFVGDTGPGINLSKMYAKTVMAECRQIVENNIATRVAKIQNCVVRNLHKFTTIV